MEQHRKIFYFAFDHQRPTGGQKETYQHVDVLNRNGFDAFAVHRDDEFRLSWFDNDTRVIGQAGFERMLHSGHDYVVVPEDIGAAIVQVPGRKVIFNKNVVGGFTSMGNSSSCDYAYLSDEVIAAFASSVHNKDILQFAYPNLKVFLVDYDVRPDLFRFRALEDKKPVIACIPKAPAHLMSVFHLVQSRSAGKLNPGAKFEWVVLEGKSESETIAILADALIFVFTSIDEGLPRLPLEAMASGCLVVAYAGGPLPEYLPAEYGVAYGDLVGMAQRIEGFMNAQDPPLLQQYGPITRAARQVAERYCRERQEQSVLSAWEQVLRAC
jgi:hypothetical protein